eukprot:gene316-329_t
MDGSESSLKKYRITLTYLGSETTPGNDLAGWTIVDPRIIGALDTSVQAYARKEIVSDSPSYFMVGSKVFSANGHYCNLSSAYCARRGYYAALKSCLAGLVLVCDMSVTSFLQGGDLVDLMVLTTRSRDLTHFLHDASRAGGLHEREINDLNKVFKNVKCKVTHLGHRKKIKSLGPAANNQASVFVQDGKRVTVADYFAEKYGATALRGSGGRLRYPYLPTVNFGSKEKPILVPAELVYILPGQCMSNRMNAAMTAEIIRYAAVPPQERMSHITGSEGSGESVISILRGRDATARAFGLDGIDPVPMKCPAVLLPQAKLHRCNKSVSYCTPAYYAHWASKRANTLLAAGASPRDLAEISSKWAGELSPMFFI